MRCSRFKTIGLSAAIAVSAVMGMSSAAQAQSASPTIDNMYCQTANGFFGCSAQYTSRVSPTLFWSGAGTTYNTSGPAGTNYTYFTASCTPGERITINLNLVTWDRYLEGDSKSSQFTCSSEPFSW